MLHFHKTKEFICIEESSTYNFMFYVIGRRLNNSVLTRFMRTHAFLACLYKVQGASLCRHLCVVVGGGVGIQC
jgi:hypothetical protein